MLSNAFKRCRLFQRHSAPIKSFSSTVSNMLLEKPQRNITTSCLISTQNTQKLKTCRCTRPFGLEQCKRDHKDLLMMMNQTRTAASSTVYQETSTSFSANAEPMVDQLRKRESKIQNCDFSMLAACVAEMKQKWVPAKIDQVLQPDTSTLCLLMRNEAAVQSGNRGQWLYLCWHQTHARLSSGPSPDRGSSSEAYSLAEQMQAAIRGLILLDIDIPMMWERVATLKLGPRLDECTHHLYLEVMGNYSNLVLTDEHQKILACARQISNKMSSKRSLQTGELYTLPPARPAATPSTQETASEWMKHLLTRASETGKDSSSLSSALCSTYKGMSPSMVEGICIKAGVAPPAALHDISEEKWKSLHAEWIDWIRAIENSSFKPIMAPLPDGKVSVIGAYRGGIQGAALELVDTYYRMPEEEDIFGRLLSRVSGAVQKAIKRLQNKQIALKKQLDQVTLSDSHQKQGDLIIANLYKYERGADSLKVVDWDTGDEIVIKLDPSEPALEQAEGFFKKARKLRRTSENVVPLLHQSGEDLDFLHEIEVQLDDLQPGNQGDLQALREIEDELVQRQMCKPPADSALAAKGASKARKAKKRSSTAGPDFREFQSPSGFQVLVGRNNIQNDELTHKVANDSDLWFHARGWPGSHTVLRIPSGRTEDKADLQFAANAAAYFSKAKTEGRAQVVYAFVKDLKKPKGARPGQVLVTKEKVITARPSSCPAARK